MFRKLLLPSAGLALLLGAAPALAQPTPQDVRCFMLSNLFAQKASTDQARKLAQVSGFYYLGKIQAMSDADLRRNIAEQQRAITQATASADMQSCARAVQASGLRMQSFAPPPPPAAPAPKK